MKPKNILILCSDEHARPVTGCYGHPVVKTPVLDRLAAGGVKFTKAYTPSPICIPARASLAAGTQVHETRCWSSAEPYRGQHRSWMHDLRDGGYNVTSIGKLHFGTAEEDHGFTEEIVPMYLANDGKGWPQGLLRDPLPLSFDEAAQLADEIGAGDTSYTGYDRKVTDHAIAWIKNNAGGKAWSLFVSWVSPHFPLKAPEEFYDLYKDAEIPDPIVNPTIERHPALKQIRKFWSYDDHFDEESRVTAIRSYYGLCSFLDHNIGQVLKALEDSGTLDNTIILYISDHGEMLGNHGFWAKSVMYEDSVGVPMILSGPGVKPGDCDIPVSLTDVAATARGIAGIPETQPPKIWQSTSLLEIAEDPPKDRFIISEYHDGGCPSGFYMLRKGQWKLVHYAGDYPSQLFDMEADPDELNDLSSSADHAEILDELEADLRAVLDPEEVNAQAFADQAKLVEAYGGKEAIQSIPTFNHTPIEG